MFFTASFQDAWFCNPQLFLKSFVLDPERVVEEKALVILVCLAEKKAHLLCTQQTRVGIWSWLLGCVTLGELFKLAEV